MHARGAIVPVKKQKSDFEDNHSSQKKSDQESTEADVEVRLFEKLEINEKSNKTGNPIVVEVDKESISPCNKAKDYKTKSSGKHEKMDYDTPKRGQVDNTVKEGTPAKVLNTPQSEIYSNTSTSDSSNMESSEKMTISTGMYLNFFICSCLIVEVIHAIINQFSHKYVFNFK